MTWSEGTVGQPEAAETDEGEGSAAPRSGNPMAALGNRQSNNGADGEYIEQVDEAKSGDKLIVVFVYCNSEESKYARATEASKKFEEALAGSFDVATALQGCETIRFDGTQMTREIRKAYKLSSTIPQLVLIDVSGKVLFKATASTNLDTLAKMLTAAKERNAELVAERDENDG